jgi:hypothetical protein
MIADVTCGMALRLLLLQLPTQELRLCARVAAGLQIVADGVCCTLLLLLLQLQSSFSR